MGLRVRPSTKRALEKAAAEDLRSVASLVEKIVVEWLREHGYEPLLDRERLGAARPQRALLATAEAVALWSVAVRWGHPEDAVAVGLLLFGILALSDSRAGRSAWLIGAAIAVQPLVLLALPAVLAVLRPRQLPGFLARAAVPAALLLAAAAAANWNATVKAVSSQPNWPSLDHRTPWTSLAPQLSHGAVATGPARALTIASNAFGFEL